MALTANNTGLDLAHLLTRVERRVVTRLAAVLKASDLTVEEWRVMSLLSDGQGHSMTDVAEYILLPAPTLTKLIDRMVAATLVYRRVDDLDRRRVLIFLSERGRTRRTEIANVIAAEQAALEEALGPEETALLSVLLNKAATRF